MNDMELIFRESHTVAVVGMSSNPTRPSYRISLYLKEVGYRIIPVNPNEREVHGLKAYSSLEEIPEKIDLVVIFRRSEFVPPIIESAIRVGAKAVWMVEGVSHPQAAQKAREAGLKVVMDRCIFVEHHRWAAEQKNTSIVS
ncbi:MAG: CoA-binding protein [Acidobacteria bacterium RIFCSPLOWO2_12_FULL_54_10]|nr:MAG: CoA-binding protein [Acidobacteria bacterium RIFCSPLOWO2_12_FULL_54_10]